MQQELRGEEEERQRALGALGFFIPTASLTVSCFQNGTTILKIIIIINKNRVQLLLAITLPLLS